MGGIPFSNRAADATVTPTAARTHAPVLAKLPEPTPKPLEPTPELRGKLIQIRYSWYYPPLGGVNTSRPDAPHLARCANGDRWQPWVGRGIACPPQWAFGTKLRAFGRTWTCVDRGGAIRYVNGIPWVDFLVSKPHVAYGTVMEAIALSD
jgi:hypothetical protein